MEGFSMARQSKREYLRSIYHRYQHARRAQKTVILEEFCKVCGYNRKYAIWLLNRPLPKTAGPKRITARSATYSQTVVRMLAKVWEACGYLCSQRLKAVLAHWLPWIKQRFNLTPELEQQLLAISPRQMDRRLRAHKRTMKRRLYGTTRPGSLLKRMIPIKTDHWDVKRPGFIEVDLVSHSGSCAAGDFIYSLNLTDIYSGWVETRAVMGKGETAILHALKQIQPTLPFKLLGLDSDNGGEFINHHLWRYCQGQGIQFTRSRPYKKDDNAHIEQKNWTHVRKLLGWDRYDTVQALQAMNRLYEDLRIFQNLFQPSMKLRSKIRKGSRLIRRYDTPRTPFERVLDCQQADPKKVAALDHTLKTTDPFELSGRIDQQLEHLYQLANRADRAPRETPPLEQTRQNLKTTPNQRMPGPISHRTPSPWRDWTFSKKLQRQQQDIRRQMRHKFGQIFS